MQLIRSRYSSFPVFLSFRANKLNNSRIVRVLFNSEHTIDRIISRFVFLQVISQMIYFPRDNQFYIALYNWRMIIISHTYFATSNEARNSRTTNASARSRLISNLVCAAVHAYTYYYAAACTTSMRTTRCDKIEL